MPRPCKRRRICAMPRCDRFGPINGSGRTCPSLTMTLDEFETIRLIDLEGMTQEECALQMDIARTTAQAIYNSARVKLAECLVKEKDLNIEGGSYVLCDGRTNTCGRIHSPSDCPKNTALRRKSDMRIAVTYEDGMIFQHFGHTEQFKVYDVKDNTVTSSDIIDTNGSGHGALAGLLLGLGADVLICGGIGGGARMALDEAGIKLYGGVSGSADEAVEALLAGRLEFNPDVMCSHHGGHHEGNCGGHGGTCGESHESCGGHQ